MSSLAVVLGWKFNHAEGITTREGRLVNWPSKLGPPPTRAEIETYTAEFAAVADDLKAGQELNDKKILTLIHYMAGKEGRTVGEVVTELRPIFKGL